MYDFCYYFTFFFIYSVLGWVVESIACSKIEKRIVLNRGFLIGPYIPIYGTAALIMTFFLTEYKTDPFVLFCMAVVYASLLEYATSYIMEKLFSARWWSYEHEKFNLNGRICLKDSLLFGVLGFFVINFANPFIISMLDQISKQLLIQIALVIVVIFICDYALTIWILSKLKIRAKKIQGDATAEIDQEAKQLLAHYRFLYKRLFKAFPKIQFTTKRGDILIDRVRKRFDEVDQFLIYKKQDAANIKKKIKELKRDSSNTSNIQKYREKLKEIRRRKLK